jgi:hypothetical protein
VIRGHGDFWLGFSLGLFLLARPAAMLGQRADCTARELQAALPSDAAVYRDAVALSQTLGKNGFVVKCLLNSMSEGTFEGQTGAATFRTDRGTFEVLFLPQSKSFDHLEVIEERNGFRYSYWFKGPPQPWPANLIDSAFRIYFIRHRNLLFVVDRDAELAARLEKFARSQP